MKRLIQILATVIVLASLMPIRVSGAACDPNGTGVDNGINCAVGNGTSTKSLDQKGGFFSTIADALIFIVGAVAVIMIIIGGLRYVLSAGDAKATASAKDTILYAIIGLIVAILAYAAVQFIFIKVH